jgi:hypothetical protein
MDNNDNKTQDFFILNQNGFKTIFWSFSVAIEIIIKQVNALELPKYVFFSAIQCMLTF